MEQFQLMVSAVVGALVSAFVAITGYIIKLRYTKIESVKTEHVQKKDMLTFISDQLTKSQQRNEKLEEILKSFRKESFTQKEEIWKTVDELQATCHELNTRVSVMESQLATLAILIKNEQYTQAEKILKDYYTPPPMTELRVDNETGL